jgi:hypothetical protein
MNQPDETSALLLGMAGTSPMARAMKPTMNSLPFALAMQSLPSRGSLAVILAGLGYDLVNILIAIRCSRLESFTLDLRPQIRGVTAIRLASEMRFNA